MQTTMPIPTTSHASSPCDGAARPFPDAARGTATPRARERSGSGTIGEKGATSMRVLLIGSAIRMLPIADLTD